MIPNNELLRTCLIRAIAFNPCDNRNRIARRAAYYAQLEFYETLVYEKQPLDAARAAHYGLMPGEHLGRLTNTITVSEQAELLQAFRRLYSSRLAV